MDKISYSQAVTQPRQATHIGRRSSFMRGGSAALTLKFLIVFSLSGLSFYILRDWPHAAILIADLIFCFYLTTLFKSKYRYLFFIHPVFLLIASQLYDTPFLEGGDGLAYAAVVSQYIDPTFTATRLNDWLGTLGLFGLFNYAHFGATPVYVVPKYFFASHADDVYYLWQGTFHVVLCAAAITMARLWRAVSDKYLFAMALFAVVSPSFFDLGAAPTRHIVTFISVFFLFIAYTAFGQKFSAARVIGVIVGIMLVLISKAALLLPFFLFVFVDQILLTGAKLNRRKLILIALTGVGLAYVGNYLLNTFVRYEEIATTGAATFSEYTQLPLLGWVVKFVYALLAPFPWSEAPHFIATNYGGNWLLFLMHTLSSLTGLYLFFIMLIHARRVFHYDPELTRLLVYGLIMSLSILRGAIGFHTYLLIYFPFFAPLLFIKKYQLNLVMPLGFIALLEALILALK
jgi:hypothetical protein